MSRQGPYRDLSAYSESEIQHMASQRMQQNAGGRADSFPPEQGDPYVPAQWDRDGPRRRTPSSHPYSEARHGGNAGNLHHAQISDPKLDLENEANKRPRFQSHEQDMELGYEDKPSLLTFEVLEQKFQDEILKLLKEQSDAEDAEIVRHRERIVDINKQYQEKLAELRARQTNRREEFLRKESERRLQHYQQAGLSNPLITTGSNDLRSHAGPIATEAHRAYQSVRANYDGVHAGAVAMEDHRAYPSTGAVAMEAYQAYPSTRPDYGREPPSELETHRVYYPSVEPDYEREPPLGLEAHRVYPSAKPDYEREPPPYGGGGRSQGTEGRVPMPAGRVYNNSGARRS